MYSMKFCVPMKVGGIVSGVCCYQRILCSVTYTVFFLTNLCGM